MCLSVVGPMPLAGMRGAANRRRASERVGDRGRAVLDIGVLQVLERYFHDSGAAMLLMECYSYLIRLSDAVAARLAQDGDG
jgi:hypothetical protein